MPIVEITLFEGRSNELKRKLIEEVSKCIANTLEIPIEQVWVVLREEPKENFGFGGKVG
ncbi:MAG: 2-hydroxymuconate tautomerase [Candidatus Hydrothermarchaeota archaeon]|nr:MAG: 2-hydroxymuconate tautomerase [Candidatus Hydrothermarchaeota archaeon]